MKTVRTTVSLSPEQLKQLQLLADQHGLSTAWVIRQAVSEFLERMDKRAGFDPLQNVSAKGDR